MDDVRIHVAELFRDWLQDSSIRRKNTMWLAAGKTSVIIYVFINLRCDTSFILYCNLM